MITKYFRPFASDAEIGGVGFTILAIESIVAGEFEYDTAKAGTAVPLIGTDVCGLPRTPAESRRSQVTTDGWRLKSVNHSHAESDANDQRRTTRTGAADPLG